MARGEADFTPVRFSTEDLPERDRIPIWREFFGPKIIRAEIEPLSDTPFRAEITLCRLPGVCLMSQCASPIRLSRSSTLIADDGNDDVGLVINLGGRGIACHRGREVAFGEGEAVSLAGDERGSLLHTGGQFIGILVPRAALAARVKDLGGAIARPLPRNSEALRLLLIYLQTIREELPLATPEVLHLVTTYVHDLAALAIGATRDGTALAEARGLSAARLKAIKADIIANLGRHDLSLNLISQRQRLSARHIRRLFRAEDTSFSDFVLEERLVRANHMLGDPRFAGRTISAIAFECGFNDASYFNRAFRRRFGAVPSDVRGSF